MATGYEEVLLCVVDRFLRRGFLFGVVGWVNVRFVSQFVRFRGPVEAVMNCVEGWFGVPAFDRSPRSAWCDSRAVDVFWRVRLLGRFFSLVVRPFVVGTGTVLAFSR